MAGRFRALQLLFFLTCSILLLSTKGDFNITEGSFSRHNVATFSGAYIDPSGSLALIPEDNPKEGKGVGYHRQPVRMLDFASNRTASFSTWFKSHQIPESYNNTQYDRRGDGMTFCFSSQGDWVSGGFGQRLGFFPTGNNIPSNLKLFAVEFDTFENDDYGDPSDPHIGIDVGTPNSTVTVTTTSIGVIFWQGKRVDIYSWIDYNGTSKVMQIRVANNNTRPANAALTHTIDLYKIMDEEMWVGFSAGTGKAHSFYFIDEWEFKIWGLPPKSRSSSLGLTVGLVVGGLVVLAAGALGLFILVRHRRRSQDPKADELIPHMVGMPDYYSYKQLSVATNGFSEATKLGVGGFGSVHQGVLPSNGTTVAVKRVSADSKQGEREFLAEVSIISQLRHRNVVQLLGWCKDRGKFLLVYELMPNGSLDKVLFHPKSPEKVLSWEQRMRIVWGLASGLHYLHEGWQQQVIHRDVKSSNIMLDDGFNAKLGDFGLARLVDHSKNATTTIVAGTYGYIAPEASGTGKFTDKTDVYAFGAVALETATGRKAFDGSAPDNDIHLVDMVWRHLSNGTLISAVDRRLEGKFDVRDLEVCVLLGLLCSHPDPKSRPSMRQVVQVLAGDAPVPPVPAKKPSAVFSSDDMVTVTVHHRISSSDTNLSSSSSVASTSTFSSSSFMSKTTSSIGEGRP